MIEKREDIRIPVEIGAQIRKGTSIFMGAVLNLSLNGMFLKVFTKFDEGDAVRIIFYLPESKTRIEALAEIRWQSKLENSSLYGMGLNFKYMNAEHRQTLGTFISKQLMAA